MSSSNKAISLPLLAPVEKRNPFLPSFGTDIGGVLMDADKDRGGFNPAYGHTEEDLRRFKPFSDTLEVLPSIVRSFGRTQSFVVSKCRETSEQFLREWLVFWGLVGSHDDQVPMTNVHFCRERADKADIIRKNNFSVFVDDRAEVLCSTLKLPLRLRVLFGPPGKDADDWKWLLQLPRDSFVGCDQWGTVREEIARVFPNM